MKHRLAILLLATLAPLAAVLFILAYPHQTTASQNQPAAKYSTPLQEALSDTPETVAVIIRLKAKAALRNLPPTKLARRTAVMQQLKTTANQSQASLRQQLHQLQANGAVQTYQPFWIINGIAATLTPNALATIAQRDEVAHIELDAAHRYFDPPTNWPQTTQQPLTTTTATRPTWGVERSGAPWVWHGLGISGDSVVVAIMDSGVDWHHPLLQTNYRGWQADGSVNHAASWFSPGDPSLAEPTDPFGHGTHVAGTAVGQAGIGIAPAAQWIAVNLSNASGFIFDSTIYQGFEWLLAPAGDPALAPDVVNNSWSGDGQSTDYQEAVAALHAAGILPVFAVGNEGPWSGTVGSPASYADVLAVGASDDIDQVAWFSSRGPSPQTDEPKPTLVAPGTAVFSAQPHNQFAYLNGTSMATPHVTGAAALLLSANPTLTPADIQKILRETAVAIAPTHPNANSGWGRLDALAAVQTQVANVGLLAGEIYSANSPLANATITLTTPSQAQLTLQSDEAGKFQAMLQPGDYQVQTAVFGHVPTKPITLTIAANQTSHHHLALSPLPTATIYGQVLDSSSQPIAARITILGTPVTTTTDNDGSYQIALPTGTYQLVASANGYKLGKATRTIRANQNYEQSFTLATAPTILLLDSGQWYYESYADYYKTALFDSDYAFDFYSLRSPPEDIPTLEQLTPYDVVVWSAPHDSIGRIGSNDVITNYLGQGGNLFVSGENVAFYDGAGFIPKPWFSRQLGAFFVDEVGAETAVLGEPASPFANLTLSLNGSDSANNQTTPDQVGLPAGSLTKPIFHYDSQGYAGLLAGHCQPFQAVYLGFGLEGVTGAANRAAIIQRSFDHFQAPLVPSGLAISPAAITDFAIPGQPLTYTFTVRNLSETLTETVSLALGGHAWPTTLLTDTLTLGPCGLGQTVLRIDVPATAQRDEIDQISLTAVSPHAETTATIEHKTPGQFLLVDDQRWYDHSDLFLNGLAAHGVVADVWKTDGVFPPRGSPPLDLLKQYEIVFWTTGYDWFAPVTTVENQRLEAYLAQNGRLFLNSQDYLFHNLDTPLTLTYLDIISQAESITPTQVYAEPSQGLAARLAGPLPLDYDAVDYQNFSDGLVLGGNSQPFLWHNQGSVAGLFHAGANWRTAFLDIPLETMPLAAQADLLNGVAGWLSDWGDSTFTVGTRTAVRGSTHPYTISLRSFVGITGSLRLTNSLPSGLSLVPSSLGGGATYDADSHQILWQGHLSSTHLITYLATVEPDAPTQLENELAFFDERLGIQFTKTATLWVETPDLSDVALTAVFDPQQLTYQLVVRNRGVKTADSTQILIRLPDTAFPLTDTLASSSGATEFRQRTISWTLALAPQQTATATIALTTTPSIDRWHRITAVIQDGITHPLIHHLQQFSFPQQLFYPLIQRDKPLRS